MTIAVDIAITLYVLGGIAINDFSRQISTAPRTLKTWALIIFWPFGIVWATFLDFCDFLRGR